MNVAALWRVRLARLTFIDGLILGMTYYVSVPMVAVLAAGRIGPEFVPISDYRPYVDTTTSYLIIGGIAALSLVRLLIPGQKTMPLRSQAYSLRYLLRALLLLYFATTIISFFVSGVASGGHWFRASHELMETSPGYVALKQISNITRTIVFGALATVAVRDRSAARRALVIGATIVLVDLFATFNRITIVYFLVLVLVCFRRRALLTCGALGGLLLSGAYVSSGFTEFRGLVGMYGYSPSGFSQALDGAVRRMTEEEKPFVDQMNGVFESINITVFNYVVQNRGQLGVSTSDVIVRPLTTVIPRAALPSRPPPFASVLGKAITGSDAAALNSTLWGEFYAGAAVPGLLIWLLFLPPLHLLYVWLARANPAYGPIGALVAFAWWRFDTSFLMNAGIFAVLIHFLLLLSVRAGRDLFGRPRRRLPPPPPPRPPLPAAADLKGSIL
jgi:hypothetical protein